MWSDMKKQIVITLTEIESGLYTGKIYGKTEKGNTESVQSSTVPQPAIDVINQLSVQAIKIQKWMEQIA